MMHYLDFFLGTYIRPFCSILLPLLCICDIFLDVIIIIQMVRECICGLFFGIGFCSLIALCGEQSDLLSGILTHPDLCSTTDIRQSARTFILLRRLQGII